MLDYEGLTVRDLKRIVNREEATPAAIGLFVVYDNWEQAHGRRSVVNNKLLRYIESKWAYSPHANELDYWIGLAGQLRSLELQGIQQGQRAQINLLRGGKLIARTAIVFQASWYTALYKQAMDNGLDVSKRSDLPRFDEAEQQSDQSNIPTEEEIELVANALRAHLASFLGYVASLGAVGKLLGIPVTEDLLKEGALIEPLKRDSDHTLESFGEHWPNTVKSLRRLSDIGSVRPSPSVIASVDSVLGAYLSPRWGAWAQAGVKLRELASSSKRIVDLIQHAELAATELTHE